MIFTAHIPIRWGDLDAQAHVNNAAILDYLQEARVQFLRSGPAATMLDTGVVVTAHQVQYLAPIFFDQKPLRVELHIAELGAARYTVCYQVFQNDGSCLVARTQCCPFDFATGSPRRLGSIEREQLRRYQTETDPMPELVGQPLPGIGHQHWIASRWSDQDQYRHVNNVLYFDYFQEARVHMLTDAVKGVLDSHRPQGDVMWLVARQDIEYLAQLNYRAQPYLVRTAVSRFGTTALTLVAELLDDDHCDATVFSRAKTVLVAADPSSAVPIPLPGLLRNAFEPFTVHG